MIALDPKHKGRPRYVKVFIWCEFGSLQGMTHGLLKQVSWFSRIFAARSKIHHSDSEM